MGAGELELCRNYRNDRNHSFLFQGQLSRQVHVGLRREGGTRVRHAERVTAVDDPDDQIEGGKIP